MYTIKRTKVFEKWLAAIKDKRTVLRLASRIERAAAGNLGDIRHVGEGVYEMREFFGPGWRMYYTWHNGAIVIMLVGGDKSSQKADIASAIAYARTLKE